MNHKEQKRSPEELQEYLKFKKRGFAVKSKKGKGSYSRKVKHKGAELRAQAPDRPGADS